MISEFVGPPGSGKSTSARSLAESYGGQVLKLNGFAYGASLGRAEAILTQPRLMAAASRLDWRLGVNLCRRNKLVVGLPGGVYWIEDGPLYALSRMISDDVPQRLISDVLRHLHLPDRCFVVRASATTCLYRLKHFRDGNNRLVRTDPAQAVQVVDELKRATERLIQCLPASVGVTLLDNDENVEPVEDPVV